jgi:hypothetical protein
MDQRRAATSRGKPRPQRRKHTAEPIKSNQLHSTHRSKTRISKHQKNAERTEARNWQKHGYHADFPTTGSEDRINYDELGEDDVQYDYMMQEEFGSCWLYPVNSMMEDGRLCSWKRELESVAPYLELDLCPLIDQAMRKRNEDTRGDMEHRGWIFVGHSSVPNSDMEWEYLEKCD